MKIWFVYKTINTLTGQFYVGVHKGTLDDKYLGSGKLLKRAIALHGRDIFTREILAVCDDSEDAYTLESLIVDEYFVMREDTYNLALGGRGRDGCLTTEESKDRMRKPKSQQHRAAISSGKLGTKLSDEHKAATARGHLGLKHSEETKLRMSITRSNRKHAVVECPHCGKTGGAPAMGQWHFNNCKQIGER